MQANLRDTEHEHEHEHEHEQERRRPHGCVVRMMCQRHKPPQPRAPALGLSAVLHPSTFPEPQRGAPRLRARSLSARVRCRGASFQDSASLRVRSSRPIPGLSPWAEEERALGTWPVFSAPHSGDAPLLCVLGVSVVGLHGYGWARWRPLTATLSPEGNRRGCHDAQRRRGGELHCLRAHGPST